ncbi:Transposon Ty3-I Gag-Pol polyprotein, partial [Dictyocoela roeselum]
MNYDPTVYRGKSSNNNNHTSKFCSYHKTNNHDTSECRKMRRGQQPPDKQTRDTTQGKPDHLINSVTEKINTLEIIGRIHKDNFTVLIDTGSARSWINEQLAVQNNLENQETSEIEAVMVDGQRVKSNRRTKFKLNIPEAREEFQVTANILNNMNANLILGMDFLYKQDSKIDLKRNIIILDGQKIPLLNAQKTDECTEKLLKKLTYTTTASMKTPPEITKMLKDAETRKEITLGKFTYCNHEIKLKENKIFKKKPYKVPIHLISATKKEIEKLLQMKIIRKSESENSSPAFPIPKKNNDIRLVVDYRELNKITEPDHFIFPKISEIYNELHGSTIFSQIDLNMGYYQIFMCPESIKYTAFSILNNHYEFTRMPFGLSNAPATFQRAMNTLFSECNYVKIYLDDILVHSETQKAHKE